MCSLCILGLCGIFKSCSFRSNNLCIRVCCSDRWYNLRCGWKLAGRSNSGCGNFRVDGGKINFFVFCNNCAGNRFCCDRFGCRNLFRCGFGCRSCGFRKNIFLCRLFRSRWLYHGWGFCRCGWLFRNGWFWSGRFFRNFRCRWLFWKRWLRVSCRKLPGLRYSKQEKSSPPKNP